MISKTFTLTSRALRVDSRMMRSHLLRFCLLAALLWMLVVTYWSSVSFSAPGLTFFYYVSYLNFFAISLAGCSYFATAITEEKEEMTLGLLRMAGISPVSILLGKAAPRLATAFLLLATQFPFTLLAITLGGVTTHQVLSVYMGLFAYILLLMGLGLFWSVVCRTSRTASWMTTVSLLAFFGIPSLLWIVLNAYIAAGIIATGDPLIGGLLWLVDTASDATIAWRLSTIMQTGFAEPAISFQVMSNVAAAAVLFGLAWVMFRFVGKEEPAASPERGLLARRTAKSRMFRVGRAWSSALTWKDFNFIAGGKTVMIIKFIGYGGSFPLFDLHEQISGGRGFNRQDYGESIMIGMMLAGGVEIALYASRIFREEIRWRTLAGICMIPGSIAGMAYSKTAGCLLALFPAVFYMGVGIFLNIEDVVNFISNDLDEPAVWWIGMQYLVFIHLVAFFSLFVKWGALPLAFATVFFTNFCCISTMSLSLPGSPSLENTLFVLLFLMGGAAVLLLHFGIGERLKTLASE